ncbi:CLUMA_CG018513, isoform A [Clunio marinus]|uniref:CLUMA_CG018513, isoform A n=1 Tax=Clunio marinus TaxID=568069 RepID=A0A1J1IYD3_9DIPT|nr:CLUMA_CG018513, isoform A [Clunio marinus]
MGLGFERCPETSSCLLKGFTENDDGLYGHYHQHFSSFHSYSLYGMESFLLNLFRNICLSVPETFRPFQTLHIHSSKRLTFNDSNRDKFMVILVKQVSAYKAEALRLLTKKGSLKLKSCNQAKDDISDFNMNAFNFEEKLEGVDSLLQSLVHIFVVVILK